jgi:serine/threonine protein kinase
MGLKEGTLEALVENGAEASAIANSVYPQMLQALDCIAWNGIIHRDVKPENILYITQPGGEYQFQLGDFGLCNRAVDATTFVGTQLYMAPEMFRKGGQTSKLDVWSLFVTMAWTLDVGGFRQKSQKFESTEDVEETVLLAATLGELSKIQEMAIANPEERASAAQMLVKCYNGIGLSTPRNQIPALVMPPPTMAAKVVAPALRALTTRVAQRTKARGSQKNGAAAPYRIGKTSDPLKQPFRGLRQLRARPAKVGF